MKTILSFIRVNSKGSVEKVTWSKSKDGEKSCSIEPFVPGAIELYLMASNKYGEHQIQ